MKLEDAKSFLEIIFASSYSRDNFKQLAAEVFNGYDRKEQTIYEEGIKNFTNLGLYEDEKGKKIAIFEVELLSENSLHRARVKQRNLIANQLKIQDYDSALCSFYHPNQGEWRLSFITRESSIDISSEKLKFIEQLSPSRRQSFIAGPNEGTHTAKKQFLPRIQSDNKPSFDEIVSIFEIEAVNDDFYEHYKELYLRLTEELEKFMKKDLVIAADFQEKEVSASDFAKKTLGQFVFLYFLQRKGWIKDKAHPDDRFSFSKLFDDRKRFGDNFFNDLMEPIFYESLAKKEPNFEDYSVLHHYEFPYLNGGLFEPIRDYDWEKTNIFISDTFFKNDNRTKDGDIGDGLLDVFNRFNFTVHENDSLDQDIAVDPEMLGKVFERLLTVFERKDSGSFYTPRPIVQYMCQESLINYLVTEIGDEVSSEAIKIFITNHTILEVEDIKGAELGIIAENAMALDKLLANIKVCDPAVGSGAFPMGMLSEIVGARNSLQSFLSNKQTVYDLKLHTIGQSLYGVDLDPSAVDIARLRFWLSLIIEEDTPIPLPNLEHKLMQGNSLLSSYEGVELFNDQFLVNEDRRQEKLNIIDAEIKVLENEVKDEINKTNILRIQAIKKNLNTLVNQKNKIQTVNITSPTNQILFESDDVVSRITRQVELLQSKIKQFLLPSDNASKEDLKIEIENIKWNVIGASIDNANKASTLEQLKKKRIQPFFLWKLEFIDVFKNGGFDIIIGNPPYLKENRHKSAFDGLRDLNYYQGKMDIWFIFACQSFDYLKKDKGIFSFIATNNWTTSAGASILRNKVIQDMEILKLIDFCDHMIFDSASIQTMIMFFKKSKKKDSYNFTLSKFDKDFKSKNDLLKALFKNSIDTQKPKIDRKLFINEFLIFNDNIQDKVLIKIKSKANYFLSKEDVTNGIHPHPDYINKKMVELSGDQFVSGQGVFALSKYELETLKLNKGEFTLIKPYYSGTKQINRYFCDEKNLEFIIYTNSTFKNKNSLDDYPNIKNHLDKFNSIITSDNRPYGLHRSRKEDFFIGEKIVSIRKCSLPSFSYVDFDSYFSAAFYIISPKDMNLKFLTGLLNSKLIHFWLINKGKMQGSAFQIDKAPLLSIPIKIPNDYLPFVKNVEHIIKLKKDNQDTTKQEDKLDQLIYKLYDLNRDEISTIEDKVK